MSQHPKWFFQMQNRFVLLKISYIGKFIGSAEMIQFRIKTYLKKKRNKDTSMTKSATRKQFKTGKSTAKNMKQTPNPAQYEKRAPEKRKTRPSRAQCERTATRAVATRRGPASRYTAGMPPVHSLTHNNCFVPRPSDRDRAPDDVREW